jgi:hypothetical protein
VETDYGLDEEDSNPHPVTGGALTGSDEGVMFKKKQHLKADKWPLLGQTKEVRLQAVAVLWRKMEVVVLKKVRNRPWCLAAHIVIISHQLHIEHVSRQK